MALSLRVTSRHRRVTHRCPGPGTVLALPVPVSPVHCRRRASAQLPVSPLRRCSAHRSFFNSRSFAHPSFHAMSEEFAHRRRVLHRQLHKKSPFNPSLNPRFSPTAVFTDPAAALSSTASQQAATTDPVTTSASVSVQASTCLLSCFLFPCSLRLH